LTVHHAPEGKIKGVALGVAGLRNSGQGLFGGYPGAPSLLMLLEDTNVEKAFADGNAPGSLEELSGNRRLLPYCEFDLRGNDVLYMRMSSGGGYGDPLEREPEAVLRDVEDGIISAEDAASIYGVVVSETDSFMDISATERLRANLREERLK
jgi:N-methylhydantoinase B